MVGLVWWSGTAKVEGKVVVVSTGASGQDGPCLVFKIQDEFENG